MAESDIVGRLREQLLLHALSLFVSNTPTFFKRVRRASYTLDIRGIDFLLDIITAAGEEVAVPLQVKGSQLGVDSFFERHPHYAVSPPLIYKLHFAAPDFQIRRDIYRLLLPVYRGEVSYAGFVEGVESIPLSDLERELIARLRGRSDDVWNVLLGRARNADNSKVATEAAFHAVSKVQWG